MATNEVIGEGALTQDTKKIINDNFRSVVRCSTALAVTSSTTLAAITGMTTDILKPGTYTFRIVLPVTATGNGGVKIALKQGTASMVTSIVANTYAYTASAIASTAFTTATDAASIVAATAAYTSVIVEGTIVIGTAGTLQLQGAQNASSVDTTTFAVGSRMEFQPIGATIGV